MQSGVSGPISQILRLLLHVDKPPARKQGSKGIKWQEEAIYSAVSNGWSVTSRQTYARGRLVWQSSACLHTPLEG